MIFKPYTDLPEGLYRGTYRCLSKTGRMHVFDLIGFGTVAVPDLHVKGQVSSGQLERCELALLFKPTRTVVLPRTKQTVRVRSVDVCAINHKLLA